MLLALAALAAMVIANSPLAETYFSLLEFKIFNLSLQHWINDGLMAIFFFIVGMEIKKEILVGELKSPRQAALPIAAALGGMIFPALIYFLFNPEGLAARGWGIPMATDIAFALAVLAVFGKHIPNSLKVFLLAIAIVDDLGAIIVIALFYSQKINGLGIGIASLALGIMALIKAAGARRYTYYIGLGIIAWLGVLISGIHATIAGVIIGLLTPLQFPLSEEDNSYFSPLEDLVHKLHPLSAYFIMPVFALANAGIIFSDIKISEVFTHPVHLGVAWGLSLGKPLGVAFAALLALKLGVAQKNKDLSWGGIWAVGLLAGIGFTMSLFISGLALPTELQNFSKTGIIQGSLVSTILGCILLASLYKKKRA